MIQATEFTSWSNIGYCHCCRSSTQFTAHAAWLRDNYLCDNCGSIPRQRHLHFILDSQFPGWESKVMHESSPSNSHLAALSHAYSFSHYFADRQQGSISDGVRCENIEQLTFPSDSIDIFVTQDVLEHVFHPDVALREILRVLRPGGFHIFTAPKHSGVSPKHPPIRESRQRARVMSDGTTEHLLPEAYHGNPIGDGRSLVTWDYGCDFELLASEWAGETVQTFNVVKPNLGIRAYYNEVFVVRKA